MWDGTGVDPWLPERLAGETRVTLAERRLYKSWWGSFSGWIVQVQRRLLSNLVPDPNDIWAEEPSWTEQMTGFVQGPVLDAMAVAYDALFGPGYDFDSRPAVGRHLAEVANRMVRTPEVVFNAVASQVAKGTGAGESIPDIAARVERVLSTTATDTWRGRAVTVARTEGIGALNAGRADAFTAVAEELDGDFEQQWLSTLDLRCRPDHAAADQQRVPVGTPFTVGGESLMFPGDSTASARQRINCRCSSLLVEVGEEVDMTGRGFSDAADWWAKQINQAA